MGFVSDALRKLANLADGVPKPNAARFAIGEKSAGSILLRGNGNFEFEVVGEAQWQSSLEAICGGRSEDGANVSKAALLVKDEGNQFDSNAVAVFVDGHQVGYLPRAIAPGFRIQIDRTNPSQASVGCRSVIRGGWRRDDGDQGNFGIWLDVVQPLEIERRG